MLFNHEYIYNGMFIAIIKEVKLKLLNSLIIL